MTRDLRFVTSSRRSQRGRQALVIVQFALALVVLAAAGILGRNLERLQRLDVGFDTDRLDLIELRLPADPHRTAVSINDMADRMRARITTLPGVAAVASAILTPFSLHGIDGRLAAEGEPESQRAAESWVNIEYVSPSYFQTLRAHIARGRAFDDRDDAMAQPVAIVSQRIADHFWHGQNPVGKRLECLGPAVMCTVVGVAVETRYRDLMEVKPTVYRPSRQAPDVVFAPRALLVRTTGDPAAVIASVRAAVEEIDPTVAVGQAEPVRDLLAAPLAQPRLNAALLSVFAMAALVLASMGIFGVLTFHVAQRTRELGIRQALGATARQLRTMVLREGLLLAGIGVAVGLALSLVSMRSLRALVFDVSPTDPVALGGAIALLLACGFLTVLLPARRAARVDPAVALRAE